MNKYIVIGVIVLLGVVLLSYGSFTTIGKKKNNNNMDIQPTQNATTTTATSTAPASTVPVNRGHLVTVETNYGTFTFETFDADAPKTVQNFITLAEKGFYNNLTFHRVVPGFVIQGGDPVGNGTGGPGYKFEDELNPNTESYKMGYVKGIVAMANAGPNTNGSQFFVMLENVPLPHSYTIFGKVVSGQDVVDTIGKIPSNSVTGEPSKKVVMTRVGVKTQ